jgi:hypothetical protein
MSRRTALAGLGVLAGSESARAQTSLAGLLGRGKPNATSHPSAPALHEGRQGLLTAGYSQRFAVIRDKISFGDYPAATALFDPALVSPGAGVADNSRNGPVTGSTDGNSGHGDHSSALTRDPYLENVETGLFAFEQGDLDVATDRLKKAEKARADSKGGLSKIGRGLAWAGGTFVGAGEAAPYRPHDYEDIQQLGYLALTHLFKGQPTCYNVVRRCVQSQIDLKAKFEQELADSKAKLAEQEKSAAQKEKSGTAGNPAQPSQQQSIGGFEHEFAAFETTALRVPNAYVNPVGDYVAGLIQEIASVDQYSLRDNSRLSYESAIALYGQSPHLHAAATAMKRPRAPAGERVLHVVVGEGFAPERKELVYVLAIAGQLLPVRVPLLTPVASSVDRIEVLGSRGAITRLDPIGDFEAIAMRAQQDRTPLMMLEILASVLSSNIIGKAAHHLGAIGDWLNGARESVAHADTRGWLGLPRRFHVARITLPPKLTSVTLASVGADGRRLASQVVTIPPGESHSVLYARAVDDHMHVVNARRLWIDGKLDTESHA